MRVKEGRERGEGKGGSREGGKEGGVSVSRTYWGGRRHWLKKVYFQPFR